MPRRYGPSGYDDPRNEDRRSLGLPRDGSGSDDIYHQQSTRRSREQTSSQGLQERRYPRDFRDYPDPGNAEERAEIRVARRSREPKGPSELPYGTEFPPTRDNTSTENYRPHERINLQGARHPREFATSANTQNVIEGVRDRQQARYRQDTRRPRSERNDPGFSSQNRGGRDGRNLEDEQEYPRIERLSIRNDMVEQAPGHLDNSRDPRPQPATTRMPTYFLPSEGISTEIIHANLGKYLGGEATFRPHTNREGVPGYLIRAHRPLTQNMISELMVDSKRLPDESLRRKEVPGKSGQSYRPDIGGERDGLASTSRLPPSPHSPDEEENPSRRPSTAAYGGERNLFDRPERVESRSHRPSRESRDLPFIRSSEVRGSLMSPSSSYDSPWGGSPASQRSSRSSYSTAPSSVQGISGDREREAGHGLTQYAPRRGSTAQYMGSAQGSRIADQSYVDRRVGARVTIPSAHAARERLASSQAMQPDDDPPDWDQTPGFQGVDPRIGARVTIPSGYAARERFASSPAMQPDDDPPDWDQTPGFQGFSRGT